ncbi:hypothetical protein CK203_000654 [Vitis vinifera]|uniref:Uncharacterized protein n=1 Tax=Vitis vinifera TaxID=29760 RepID=A0A438KRV5_VITVI|nr:hypothetical protein CK203_000654 [Vitis vinifera]
MGMPTPWQASLPLSRQRSHIVAIHVQTNPSVAKPPLATPLGKPNRQSRWTNNIIEYLWTDTLPEIPKGTQVPGTSCPFHPNRGALVQAILHRTLPSVPKSFRRPVCVSKLHDGVCGNHSGGRFWHIGPIHKGIIGPR